MSASEHIQRNRGGANFSGCDSFKQASTLIRNLISPIRDHLFVDYFRRGPVT